MALVIPVLFAAVLFYMTRWPRHMAWCVALALFIALGVAVLEYVVARSIILAQRTESLNMHYSQSIDELGAGTSLLISNPPLDSGLPQDRLVLLVVRGDDRFLFPFPRQDESLDREHGVAVLAGVAGGMTCLPMAAFAIYRSRRTSTQLPIQG